MISPLLEFQDISFSYYESSQNVLEGFSLQIPPGSITSILGPNGAGKTTLLLLALGWLKSSQGKIYLSGKNLRSFSRRQLGQWIGLVPQTEYISFDFTLLEYVLFGRSPYLSPLDMPSKDDISIANDALKEVGLSDFQSKSILNLSGGEKQLLLVARALAQEPKLLLLDEPTSHLDLGNKSKLINLIRRLATRGVTILFTTHEPDFASSIATDLVLMRRGNALMKGPFSRIFTSENLSDLYGIPIRVSKVDDKEVILWS